jgi:hypothetical protein
LKVFVDLTFVESPRKLPANAKETLSKYDKALYRLALQTSAAAASTIIAVTNTSKKNESGDAGILGGSLGWRYSNHGGHYASSSVHRSSFLYPYDTRSTAICEAQRNIPILYKPSDPAEPIVEVDVEEKKKTVAGMRLDSDDKEASYHGLFPMRQLWRPAVEYPLWDDNWDGRQLQQQAAGGGEEQRRIRKEGVTRHIILIRHGQVRILGLVNIDTLQLGPHFFIVYSMMKRTR